MRRQQPRIPQPRQSRRDQDEKRGQAEDQVARQKNRTDDRQHNRERDREEQPEQQKLGAPDFPTLRALFQPASERGHSGETSHGIDHWQRPTIAAGKVLGKREQVMQARAMNPADGSGSGLGHEDQQRQHRDADGLPDAPHFRGRWRADPSLAALSAQPVQGQRLRRQQQQCIEMRVDGQDAGHDVSRGDGRGKVRAHTRSESRRRASPAAGRAQ